MKTQNLQYYSIIFNITTIIISIQNIIHYFIVDEILQLSKDRDIPSCDKASGKRKHVFLASRKQKHQ